jgi:two-component system chemotaxis response regulator CheB
MTTLVALGASLGGFDAIRSLLRPLRSSCDAALVIAQHRSPQADATLLDLLAQHCALPISEPCDRDPIEPGHVYLAPADYHLLVEPGCFSLSIDAPVSFARPSIDVLFESVAAAYRSAAVGIVLTGSSRDGAWGAAAIKRAGGRVFVQDPLLAHSPIAPEATLALADVDAVLSLDRLAEVLNQLCHSANAPTTTPTTPAQADATNANPTQDTTPCGRASDGS